MSSNVFETYDTMSNAFADKVKKAVVDLFPYLLMLANILFMVLNALFSVSLKNPFTPDNISKTLMNCATSTLAYACFVGYGNRVTKKNSPNFQHNLKVWGETSDRIRRGSFFEAFLAYCKTAVDEEREEKRIAIVVNNTRITLKDYTEIFSKMSNAELRQQIKDGVISRHDARYIRKANGNIKVRPINPLLLLCGSKAENLNDAGRAQDASAIKSIVGRPLTVIISSVVVESVFCVFGGWSMATLYNMCAYAFLIFVSCFLGYEKGASNARKTNEAVLNRIVFLERFEKKHAAEAKN